jgi:hypothetical protein
MTLLVLNADTGGLSEYDITAVDVATGADGGVRVATSAAVLHQAAGTEAVTAELRTGALNLGVDYRPKALALTAGVNVQAQGSSSATQAISMGSTDATSQRVSAAPSARFAAKPHQAPPIKLAISAP